MVAGREFLAPQEGQKIIRRLPGELHGSRKIAVEGMSNLIGVVAKPAEFGKQRRVHGAVSIRANLYPPFADEPLAKT